MSAPEPDLCECGHWSRHHSVGKHNGCGHCGCKGFVAYRPQTAAEQRAEAIRDRWNDYPDRP